MSRRDAIAMSEAEVGAFLEDQRTITIATIGRDGWPHLMPLWYVTDPLRAWTFAKSQKVRNLERDPRCTLQVEAGTEYQELRGVMFKAEAVIHRDVEDVWAVGAQIAQRYGGAQITPEVEQALRAQAAKRVALTFTVIETASWDHRKLGGTY
ncbi:MAG TPA: pyridoxamine 5'-phosphate oxidase family protein [Solirubrobacteraceae bacterium]